jgi:hypothetical protein
MAAHADADYRDLDDVRIGFYRDEAKFGAALLEHLDGPLEIGFGQREGEIGGPTILRDVLHDHVDVDVGLGQRAEDRGGDAGLVLDMADRDLRLVL